MSPLSPTHGYRWISGVVASTLLLLLSSLALVPLARAAPLAVVTIVDGEAQLIRAHSKYALIEGARLEADDLVEVTSQGTLLRVEFSDGLRLSLGPATRAVLAPKLSDERGSARIYLLQGWAKFNADAGHKAPSTATAVAVFTPLFDAIELKGDSVVMVSGEGGELFAESGSATLRPGAGAKLSLKSGEAARLGKEGKPPVASPRPSAGFLQQLPRAFMDTLPARAAMFQNASKPLKRLADVSESDLRAWLVIDPALRRAYLPDRLPERKITPPPPRKVSAPMAPMTAPSASPPAPRDAPEAELGWKPLPLRPGDAP
ncbi:hypothetical protein [Leptothrix ochracea]|uniref:hypothetical protein n=1 Tax=Leptothrix ochracea TaxID=735331 RepID=UPI0034E1F8B6